ncbi:MAG TPA: S53 family peptidase, partial [Gemmataceae bacterium]|nr:S53 family peptidase [Gemmataceae bacterium]
MASSTAHSAALNLVAPSGLFSATPTTGYTPAQLRQAYGFNLLSGLTGNNYNNAGKGETIAIVDVFADPAISHDVQQFDEYFNISGAAGNPANTGFLKVVNQYGGSPRDVAGPGLSGWDAETSADVEWAHAIAPGANILLVQAANQDMADEDAAVNYAASQPNVSVVSMSYSSILYEFPNEYAYDNLYTTPVGHQGVAFVAASGDDGASTYYQQVSPNVIVVGGTTLPADQNGNPVRSQEVGWSFGSDTYNRYLASGGGISEYETQPAYQQGTVTQSTTYRTDPDVAYDADPATGVPIYDSLSTPQGLPWGDYGGTSIAAPQWAALVAIADQARAAKGESTLDGATQLLPALYQIAQSDPHAFHDITQGNNGYSAGPGYDLVTGLGTPNAQYLIPDPVKIDSSAAVATTVYWTGDAGDYNWDNPGNWSFVDPARRNVPESVLPGASDNVVIDVAGATVNHAITSYDTIRSLKVTAPGVTLNLDLGTLDLSGGGTLGTFQAATGDVVNLIGGVLKSANVTSGTTISVRPSETGVVDGGVLNGTVQVLDASTLDLEGNWTNNGTITAGTGSTLILGDYWNASASDPAANSDTWVNHGTITASNATVELGGWLTNTANNLGTLALGSEIVELIGTLDNRQQTLALVPSQSSSTGSWILNGGRIDGGTITTTGGAALIAPEGSPYTPPANGTLDGVTLDGTLDMSAFGAYVAVVDGLTLNTDLYLSGYDAELQFNGGSSVTAGALAQNATIHLSGPFATLYNNTSSNAVLNNDPSQTVTIGRHVTISGESFTNGVFGPFDNLGTIEKTSAYSPYYPGQLLVFGLVNDRSVQAGQGVTVELDSAATVSQGSGFYFFPGQPWSNNTDGTITATQGAQLNFGGQGTNNGTITATTASISLGGFSYSSELSGTWTNNGTISATDGYLQLLGAWTNNGTVTETGATLNLFGTWTNNGTITADAASTVSLGSPSYAVSGPSDIWKNAGVLSIAPGATLNLGDYFTTDEFESGFQDRGVNLNLSQYTVKLTGIIDNSAADNPVTGGTLDLTASTVFSGEIDGGTMTGTALLVEGGTLNGVVVDTSLDDELGLTLQGSWSITVNGAILDNADLNLSGTWTNKGTITATGAYLNLSGIWTNNGTITATAYTALNLNDAWTNNGTITADATCTVSLGDYSDTVSGPSDIWKNSGVLSIAAGATL